MIVLVFIGDAPATEVTTECWGSNVPPPSAMIGAILGPRLHNSCCWIATACAAAAKAACFKICWLEIPGFVEEDRGWILGMVVRNAVA
jgi:hypothetical protein